MQYLSLIIIPAPPGKFCSYWQHRGFSLLELLISLIIASILTTIAYPFYQHHLTFAIRSQAKVSLWKLANELEKYKSLTSDFQGMNFEKMNFKEQTEYYQFSIEATVDDHYLLSAIPIGKQAKHDQTCGTLQLNDLGEQKITGTGPIEQCW